MGNTRPRGILLLTPPPESSPEKLDAKAKTRNAATTVKANSKRKRSASRQSQCRLESPPSRRRRKNEKPKQKVKDVKLRSIGACQECRKRKIRCTHHLSGTNVEETELAQDADFEMAIGTYDGAAESYDGPPSPQLPLISQLPILDALRIPFDADFGFLSISDNKTSKVKPIATKPPQQSRIRSATFPSLNTSQKQGEVPVDFDDYVPPILYHDIIGVSGSNIFGTSVAPHLSDPPELPGCTRFPRVDLNGRVFGTFQKAPGELSRHGSDENFDINIFVHGSYQLHNDPHSITKTKTSQAIIQSTTDLEKRPADEAKLSPRKKRLCQRSKADYEKVSLLR